MLLSSTAYYCLMTAITIALIALAIFVMSKIKIDSKLAGPFGISLPLGIVMWYNGFMVRDVYFVKDENSPIGVSIEKHFLLGGHLETKIESGRTIALDMDAYECAVVNESSMALKAISQAYSSSVFGSDNDAADNNEVRIFPDSVSVIPHSKIDYMPGEDFPQSVTEHYAGSSSRWALRTDEYQMPPLK